MTQMNLPTKIETDSGIQGTDRGAEVKRGMEWEADRSRRKPLHLKWIDNEVLPYSTRNYINYP